MSRFPSVPLIVEFLVYWGADLTADPDTWVPTDLTNRWNTAVELKVTEGRSEGAKQAETAEATWSLFNTDGQLTPEDARSQWWPHVDAGTPCQWIVDAGEGDYELFAGYVSSIKPVWPGRSRHLSLVTVRATGIFERLGRGESPLRPALYRAVMADNPVAFWQLDDGRDSTQAANAVPGGAPMLVDDRGVGFEVAWAEVDGPVGPERYPEFIQDEAWSGRLVGAVPPVVSDTWQVECWFRGELTGEPFPTGLPFTVWFGGTTSFTHIEVWASPPGTGISFWLLKNDIFHPWTFASDHDVTPMDGRWHYLRIVAHQDNPTTATVEFHFDGVLVDTSTQAGIIGWPYRVQTPGNQDPNNDFTFTPPAAFSTRGIAITTVNADHYQAGIGHVGETVADRIARLCLEERIPCTIDAGDTAVMGPQLSDTLLNLLQLAQATDLGRLSERHFGVHYRPAETLLNQTPAFTIDASRRELREPFDPVRDLQRLRNEWKVDRPGGSEATYADAANQLLRGRLDDSATINPPDDSTLMHEASWRTRISMARGMRYPGLGINLARSPRLIAAWQQLQLGDRAQVVSLLPQHPPGPLDQILEGRTQLLLGRRVWRAALITSPAAPYTVGIIEDDDLGRADAGDNDRLVAELAAGGMSFQVQYTDGVAWTTSGAEFPLIVEINGEYIEVSAITGASSPQTFTVRSRAVNSVRKTHPAGSAVTVVDAFVLS